MNLKSLRKTGIDFAASSTDLDSDICRKQLVITETHKEDHLRDMY